MKLVKNFAITTFSGLALITLIFLILNGILSDQIAVAIITAGATIFVGISSVVSTRRFEKEQIIEQQIREKKTPIYEKLMTITFSIFKSTKNNKTEIDTTNIITSPKQKFSGRQNSNQIIINETDELDVASQLRDILPELILWGTDNVLASFVHFRKVSVQVNKEKEITDNLQDNSDEKNLFKTLVAFEMLLFEIRKDLGHQNIKLDKGDLLTIFINDVDKLI